MRYTNEFKQNALAMVREKGIMKTCQELKIAHCTVRRWCREIEGAPPGNTPDTCDDIKLVDASEDNPENADENPGETEDQEEPQDAIATAMALLTIENMHLRETIRHLRQIISGLTDNVLL